MNIVLDGMRYELRPGTGVTRSPLPDWADNIRFDGQQLRKDRRYISSWVYDSWNKGLTLEKMETGLSYLWDADNVDTRNLSSIVLSPLFNTCTIVPSRGDLLVAFSHLNNLYFSETTRVTASGAVAAIAFAYQFTPPFQIGSQINLALTINDGTYPPATGYVHAIKAFGRRLAIVGYNAGPVNQQSDKLFYTQTLGGNIQGSMNGYAIMGSIIGTIGFVELGDFGGTLHMLHVEDNSAKFYMGQITDTPNALTTVSIASNVGSYISKLITDGAKMYAQLPDGIYDVDPTPSKLIDTSSSIEINPSFALYQNNLYFKNKKSLTKYDGANLTQAGYDINDGLPVEKFGEITAQCSSYKSIFAAVKGLSYSHILTREDNGAWQYYAKIPTLGLWVRDLFLSSSPDSIDRLWCIFGNYSFPGYFLNPNINPLQAGTYAYVPTGYFTTPIFGGGMSEEPGGFYKSLIVADKVDATQNISINYGIDGATPTTSLGNVTSINSSFLFGSPYGIDSYRIQYQNYLTRQPSTIGTTPVFRGIVTQYLKKPTEREIFDMDIDVIETAKYWQKPDDYIIKTIGSLSRKRTLSPFWYGQIPTKTVSILNPPSNEIVLKQDNYEGQRTGFIQLRLLEMP